MSIRVVVSGTGNMGPEVLAAGGPAPVLEQYAERGETAFPGGGASVPTSADPTALLDRTKPDVIIDFANAEWTPLIAGPALERGVRLVISTTGLPDAWVCSV